MHEGYVVKRSQQSISKNDILKINNEARKDKESGNEVINASTGVFLTEDKRISGVSLINQAIEKHLEENLGYPPVLGNPDYRKDVFSFLFREKEERVRQLFTPFIGATLGGTGAISHAFRLFLNEGDNVLLPDILWNNYLLVAKKAKVEPLLYSMFDDEDNFNIASVKEKIEEAGEKHGVVLLVINDPCQNPTGYCLKEEEYKMLFNLLEEEGKKYALTVLFDIAYYSFYAVENHHCALFDYLLKGKHEFLPLLAFSASKIFGLYGLRVGALIALCETSEEEEEISRAFMAEARGTYSVPNGTAQACIDVVLKDEEKRQQLDEEIHQNTLELAKRSQVLLHELEEKKIPHYPYASGFFVTLKVNDAYTLADDLKKEHIYVVPMNKHSLRLAISGMTEDEITKVMNALLCYL